MDLQSMSREELEQLTSRVEAELARRTLVWEVERSRAWAVGELERLAALQGPVPAEPVPGDGFMPGAIVEVDGQLYLNGAGTWIDYPPGDEPISMWVAVETPPEPGDPETPPAPEYEEWSQRQAHNAYMLGDRVLLDGVLYESIIDNNAHHPTNTHAWKVINQ